MTILGYNTVGSSSRFSAADKSMSTELPSMPEDGTIDDIVIYLSGIRTSDRLVKFCLWKDSDGTLVAESATYAGSEIGTGSPEWVTLNCAGESLADGTTYRVGVMNQAGSGSRYFDTGQTGYTWDQGVMTWPTAGTLATPDFSNSGERMSAYINYTASATPPDITSMTDPVVTGVPATLTGTAFEAAQGTGSVTQEGLAVTESSWLDTSVTITPLTVESTVKAYGNHTFLLTTDGAQSDSYIALVEPPADNAFTNLVAPLASIGLRITAIPDLIGGDQVRFGTVVFESDKSTPTTYTVAVLSDGSYVVSGGPFVDGDYAFLVNGWDSTDGVTPWGAEVWQTFTISMDESGNAIITNIVRDVISNTVKDALN